MTMTKKERRELEVSQMRLRECQAKIDVLFGDKPTNTFMLVIEGINFKYIPLLPDANIKFKVGEHGEFIEARLRKGVLEIMGDSAIQILPTASNCIEIKIREVF